MGSTWNSRMTTNRRSKRLILPMVSSSGKKRRSSSLSSARVPAVRSKLSEHKKLICQVTWHNTSLTHHSLSLVKSSRSLQLGSLVTSRFLSFWDIWASLPSKWTRYRRVKQCQAKMECKERKLSTNLKIKCSSLIKAPRFHIRFLINKSIHPS